MKDKQGNRPCTNEDREMNPFLDERISSIYIGNKDIGVSSERSFSLFLSNGARTFFFYFGPFPRGDVSVRSSLNFAPG